MLANVSAFFGLASLAFWAYWRNHDLREAAAAEDDVASSAR